MVALRIAETLAARRQVRLLLYDPGQPRAALRLFHCGTALVNALVRYEYCPDSKIAPLNGGDEPAGYDVRRTSTLKAPADSPKIVTLSFEPPKVWMLS